MYCAQCGTRATAVGRFCEECGAPIQQNRALTPQGRQAATLSYQRQDSELASPALSGQAISFNPTINVTVNGPPAPPSSTIILAGETNEMPLLLRAVWFLCVGLWLGLLWVVAAWLLNATIMGLPVGLTMINRVPQVMTLKRGTRRMVVLTSSRGATVITQQAVAQLPLVLRAAYFVIIGVWLSLLWTLAAWLAAALILPLPLSFWMFERLPAVTTLRLT